MTFRMNPHFSNLVGSIFVSTYFSFKINHLEFRPYLLNNCAMLIKDMFNVNTSP